MSLYRPVRLVPRYSGTITQRFDGAYRSNKPGYLRTGAPALRAKLTRFTGSTYHRYLHKAIDFSCPIGMPVYAVADGKIVRQGTYSTTGEYYVMLRIRRGVKFQVVAFYTHLKPGSFRFRTGDRVQRGQTIALSGNSGKTSGPHLHFELRRGYVWQLPRYSGSWMRFDPMPFILGTASLSQIA